MGCIPGAASHSNLANATLTPEGWCQLGWIEQANDHRVRKPCATKSGGAWIRVRCGEKASTGLTLLLLVLQVLPGMADDRGQVRMVEGRDQLTRRALNTVRRAS